MGDLHHETYTLRMLTGIFLNHESGSPFFNSKRPIFRKSCSIRENFLHMNITSSTITLYGQVSSFSCTQPVPVILP